MSRTNSIVWILGAGFSKPLGGPLLPDLFEQEIRDKLAAWYAPSDYPLIFDAAAVRTMQLYQAFKGRIWRDPEQFLDYLDTAVVAFGKRQESANLRRLGRYLGVEDPGPAGILVTDLLTSARRLLAAECSGFMVENDLQGEKWQPYHAWAKTVRPEDAIITFNYDMVVEHLFRLGEEASPLAVAFPDTVSSLDKTKVPLFKLHGSVSWGLEFGKIAEKGHDAALGINSDQIVIGSPGPSKHATSTSMLKPLWSEAMKRISSATAVVFVGYRFPETDAHSRTELLKALRNSTAEASTCQRQYVAVHTVLGPNVAGPDQGRLKGLLHHALKVQARVEYPYERQGNSIPPQYNVIQQPLYTEDFFTVAGRAYVLSPNGY